MKNTEKQKLINKLALFLLLQDGYILNNKEDYNFKSTQDPRALVYYQKAKNIVRFFIKGQYIQ